MTKAPTPETIAADLTVPERVLLFCVASDTDWVKTGVRAVTTRGMLVKGLIERKHAHAASPGRDRVPASCRMALEGFMAKRVDRPHRSGRSVDWVKVKNPEVPPATRVVDW